jgi:putative ABC transport system permease protein
MAVWPDRMRRDVGYAMRSLARSRGFTIAAVSTLAVGIGFTTAICSVVNTVLFRPLPVAGSDRLVRIVENGRPRNLPVVNYREYLEWRPRATTLGGLAASAFHPQIVIQAPTGLVRVTAGFVSLNYFDVLGARPLLGRTLNEGDQADPNVMVLSHELWQRHFGGDAGALGSILSFKAGTLAGRSLTVVGVMPASMETIGDPMECYIPISVTPKPEVIALSALIGRLRDGVVLAAASAEANVIGTAIRPPRPASAPPIAGPRFEARDFKETLLDPRPGAQAPLDAAAIRSVLSIIAAAAFVVLLMVCASVANLFLARGMTRRRELATRRALGATRWQILHQVLAESAVLAVAGGIGGAAIGGAAVMLIKRLLTVDAQGVFKIVFGGNILPRGSEIAIDGRLFAIAFAVTVATTLAFGLWPALRLSRTSQLEAVGSRSSGSTRRDTRVRAALVISELALATVLLVAAGLLTASFVRLAGVDKGYDPTNVLAFQLVLPGEYSTARKAESIEAVLSGVRALPEVAAAGFAYAGIMIGVQDIVGSFVPPGRALEEVSKETDRARLKSVGAGYLEATGAHLVEGRLIASGDSGVSPPVIVINRSVQRRYFGDASPIGAFMDWHGGRGSHVAVEIVGVVDDVRQGALAREPYPEIFMDYRQVIALQQRWGAPTPAVDQLGFGFMSFAIRAARPPEALITQVRQAIARADPNAALDAIMPLDSLVSNSLARQRFYAVLLGAFAVVAALLAGVGVFGVLSYAVTQRTREIGVRLALGARGGQLFTQVVGKGMSWAAIGIALGLGAAGAGTRYLQSILYGVTPLHAGTFVVVALAFSALSAVACAVPARRATRVDPIQALRAE